jgi:Domain of unknown function (DUF4177)
MRREGGVAMTTISHELPRAATYVGRRYEYKVLDTGSRVEDELNALGAEGWRVVGVTTKKQLFIAPPQAIILMRELEPTG